MHPYSPKVFYDPHKKTVSVTNLHLLLPCKVIMHSDKWKKLDDTFEQYDIIPFEQLEECIKPKAIIPRIKHDYLQNPERFSFWFYNAYIVYALAKLAPKPRGGSPYSKDVGEIRRISKWVYALLLHWFKLPKEEWPPALEKYFSKLCKERFEPSNRQIPFFAKEYTMKIMAKYFQTQELTNLGPDMFYDHYVKRTPGNLTRIKNHLSRIKYKLSYSPLSEIFPAKKN